MASRGLFEPVPLAEAPKARAAWGSQKVDPMVPLPAPEKLLTFRPWGFQKSDLEKFADLDHSANWNDMGLGKTLEAAWLAKQKRAKRILIITSKSGKGAYFRDWPHIHPDLPMYNLQSGVSELPTGDGVYVAHYNMFVYARQKKKAGSNGATDAGREPNLTCQLLLDRVWDLVILDEAHRIKNPENQTSRNIRKLHARHRHLMTGTGFINRPNEVWNLLDWLYPRDYGSYWGFTRRYCQTTDINGFQKIIGVKRSMRGEFRERLMGIGVRHTKDQVFPDLPEKYYTQIEVELNDTQKEMYRAIVADLEAADKNGATIFSTNVLSQLSRLRAISSATPEVVRNYWDEKELRWRQEIKLTEPSSKMDALMEHLEGADLKSSPVVIFSNFTGLIKLAKVRMDQAGINYIHMEQKDSDAIRYKKWHDSFQKGHGEVFICTLQLGSESIELTRSSTVVFLDRSWSPKDNIQGEDRLRRPGQKNAVEVIDLIGKHTVDNKIMNTHTTKMGWFREIFG